jgi:hypothetical protein
MIGLSLNHPFLVVNLLKSFTEKILLFNTTKSCVDDHSISTGRNVYKFIVASSLLVLSTQIEDYAAKGGLDWDLLHNAGLSPRVASARNSKSSPHLTKTAYIGPYFPP